MKLRTYKSKTNPVNRTLRFSVCLLFIFSVFLSLGSLEATAQKRSKPASGRVNPTLEAEKLLSAMGYWITKVDGVADASTRHAIIAFQKVEGRKRTGVLNNAELTAMRRASRPQPKNSGFGGHVEVDLTRQVLFLVDESGAVTRILPVSSGNDEKYLDQGVWQVAHTPRGTFQVTRQINGVRKAPLGSLYYPSYFLGGVAIHGSPSVPTRPASHGCVRIPNFAAKDFLGMVSVGTPIIVYD